MGETEVGCVRLQIGEGRCHRGKDTKEQNRYLYNWCPTELVVVITHLFLGGVERETSERQQYNLTQVFEPQRSILFAHLLDSTFVHKCYCQHYAQQINEIDSAFHYQRCSLT